MEEIQLYDEIYLIEPKDYINNKVKFLDKEIPNYRIYYKGKSIGTLKEMIINTDRKIKIKEMKENKNFYITIIAHLIAQYIIKRIKKRDMKYAHYLKQKHELLVEAIYNKILNGSIEKYMYLGKVWSDNEIKGAFIDYMGNKILSL
jgi:hypothetical protein